MFYDSITTDSYANTADIPIPYKENDKIYIYNCIFCNFHSGCIKIYEANSIDFLHSSCFFYSNFDSEIAGSILFHGNNSIVQHRFCACNTTTSADYGGSFSLTQPGTTLPISTGPPVLLNEYDNFPIYFNYFVECSLTHCDASSYDNWVNVFYAKFGNGLLSASNSSQNSCKFTSGYVFDRSNPVTVNYTTIANNTAKHSVAAHGNEGFYYLKTSNIINNEISSSGESNDYDSGIVYSSTSYKLTVDSCCLFGNKPGQGKLFYLEEYAYGEFIVKNSHVDSFSANDEYQIEKQNIIKDVSSFFLPHLSTYKCEAEIPLPPLHVNTQQIVQFFPVFIRIPSQTPEVFFGAVFTR